MLKFKNKTLCNIKFWFSTDLTKMLLFIKLNSQTRIINEKVPIIYIYFIIHWFTITKTFLVADLSDQSWN